MIKFLLKKFGEKKMSMIKGYMSGDHRECDEHFPPVEDAVMADKWDNDSHSSPFYTGVYEYGDV